MLIIPELQTVLILVPRTGSGALRRAVKDRYPESMLLYRHMEADGVPAGYDRWRRVGVFRHPIDRMRSLYRYMSVILDNDQDYIQGLRKSVEGKSFSDWLVTNQTLFSYPTPHNNEEFLPIYSQRNLLPENRKSQFMYLRPDLGTEIVHYKNLGLLEKMLDINLGSRVVNRTNRALDLPMTPEADLHMATYHRTDMFFEKTGLWR